MSDLFFGDPFDELDNKESSSDKHDEFETLNDESNEPSEYDSYFSNGFQLPPTGFGDQFSNQQNHHTFPGNNFSDIFAYQEMTFVVKAILDNSSSHFDKVIHMSVPISIQESDIRKQIMEQAWKAGARVVKLERVN